MAQVMGIWPMAGHLPPQAPLSPPQSFWHCVLGQDTVLCPFCLLVVRRPTEWQPHLCQSAQGSCGFKRVNDCSVKYFGVLRLHKVQSDRFRSGLLLVHSSRTVCFHLGPWVQIHHPAGRWNDPVPSLLLPLCTSSIVIMKLCFYDYCSPCMVSQLQVNAHVLVNLQLCHTLSIYRWLIAELCEIF